MKTLILTLAVILGGMDDDPIPAQGGGHAQHIVFVDNDRPLFFATEREAYDFLLLLEETSATETVSHTIGNTVVTLVSIVKDVDQFPNAHQFPPLSWTLKETTKPQRERVEDGGEQDKAAPGGKRQATPVTNTGAKGGKRVTTWKSQFGDEVCETIQGASESTKDFIRRHYDAVREAQGAAPRVN